jgi:hypothetical protein
MPSRIVAAYFAVLLLAGCSGGDAHGADESTSTTSTGTGADGNPSCSDLIDCVKEVTPEAQTEFIAKYGAEGSCWDLDGVTEDDCLAECQALLEDLQELYPDETACWECVSDEDCQGRGDAIYCSDAHDCTDVAPWVSCATMGVCFEFSDSGWGENEKKSFCEDAHNGTLGHDQCGTDGVGGVCTGWVQGGDYGHHVAAYVGCDSGLLDYWEMANCELGGGSWSPQGC